MGSLSCPIFLGNPKPKPYTFNFLAVYRKDERPVDLRGADEQRRLPRADRSQGRSSCGGRVRRGSEKGSLKGLLRDLYGIYKAYRV